MLEMLLIATSGPTSCALEAFNGHLTAEKEPIEMVCSIQFGNEQFFINSAIVLTVFMCIFLFLSFTISLKITRGKLDDRNCKALIRSHPSRVNK